MGVTRGAVGLAAAVSAVALVVAFLGALSTGAASLLALAIHGLAALSSQLLMWRALAGRGDGCEGTGQLSSSGTLAFWSYAAAMLLFAMGAAAAIQNGVAQALQPRELSNLAMAYAAVSVVLLLQLAVTLRMMAPLAGSGDAVVATVMSEARAAVGASVVLIAGLVAVQVIGAAAADGIAAILIGLVLAFVAIVMAIALRRVLAAAGTEADAALTSASALPAALASDAAGSGRAGDMAVVPGPAESFGAIESGGGADRPAAQASGASHGHEKRRGKKKKRHRV